ncbi:MAG: hypothetical protein GC162_08760 [Planctomycetes bacterium]|nr:hypothetical protein [Planctomycetota bacterium]
MNSELLRLCTACVEDRLTLEDVATLEVLLRDDPDARDQYIRFMRLNALLERYNDDDAYQTLRPKAGSASAWGSAEVARSKPTPTLSRASRRSVWYAAAALIALAVAVALTIAFRPAAIKTAPDALAAVALLSDVSDNAQFSGSSAAPSLGSDLMPGMLALEAGHAQVMFRSGAVVDLSGPCQFEMTGENRGFLHGGQLSAIVPAQAHGFTIDAPRGARVIDLGTEFEAFVDQQQVMDVAVLDGHVAVTGDGQTPAMLAAGDSRRIERGAIRTTADLLDYARWRVTSREFRHDPALLAYYAFSPAAVSATRIADESEHHQSLERLGGVIEPGRLVHTSAIALNGVNDALIGRLPSQSVHAMTLLMSVRIDKVGPDLGALLQTDGWGTTGLHVNFDERGVVTVGLGAGGPLLQSRPVILPDHLGKWMQLALIADPDQRTVTLYLDGEAIGSLTNVAWRTLSLNAFAVGGWYRQSGGPLSRPLSGAIDELAIFDRALPTQSLAAWWAVPSTQIPVSV